MKVTKQKIGWGILGPGRIGRDFAMSLRELPDAYVAAAGSRTYERSVEFCKEFGGTPYGSYEELCSDPDVDIIYVAVPHPMHEAAVKLAAEHGKNILCEKPFACSKASAERMFGYAKDAGVFIMEGLWSRFFEGWQFARKVLTSGELGKCHYVMSNTCWGWSRLADPSDRLLDPNLAGGALLDAGLYSMTAMTYGSGILEEPVEFFSSQQFTETGVDHESQLFLRFADGMSANISCSLFRKDFWTTFVCEEGIVTVPRHRNPDTVIVQKGSVVGYAQMDWKNETKYYFPFVNKGFQFEAAHVQDCLRQGLLTSPMVDPSETLMYAGWCDRVRAKSNFVFPFEK